MDWAQTAMNLLTSGTVAGIIGAAFARPKTRAEAEKVEADAADVLTGKALTMVSRLEEQVTRAQDRVRDLDQETMQLRRDLAAAHGQVAVLDGRIRSLIAAILAPDATLQQLRAMVGHGPGINGRS